MGTRIKILAHIMLGVEIVALFIVFIVGNAIPTNLSIAFFFIGIFVAIILHQILYAFGCLIEANETTAKNSEKMLNYLAKTKKVRIGDLKETYSEAFNEEDNIPNADECPSCFSKISKKDAECKNCGYKLKRSHSHATRVDSFDGR